MALEPTCPASHPHPCPNPACPVEALREGGSKKSSSRSPFRVQSVPIRGQIPLFPSSVALRAMAERSIPHPVNPVNPVQKNPVVAPRDFRPLRRARRGGEFQVGTIWRFL
jgi:hypothetical protein